MKNFKIGALRKCIGYVGQAGGAGGGSQLLPRRFRGFDSQKVEDKQENPELGIPKTTPFETLQRITLVAFWKLYVPILGDSNGTTKKTFQITQLMGLVFFFHVFS